MISINVNDIGNSINNLNKLIEDYNEVYLNLFNSINSLQSLWIGDRATRFFNKIDTEKKETESVLKKVKDQKSLYIYIYNGYKELGNTIKCNLDAKDQIINKINNCIDKTNEILNIYENIDTVKMYKERESILKKYENTKKILNKYNSIKVNVKNIYSKIEEIEQEVNKRLENMEYMQIEDFIIGN